MATGRNETESGLRCMWGILLLVLFFFGILSLYSYDWTDVSLLHAHEEYRTPHNLIGLAGAWLSFVLFALLGVGAYLTPFWCLFCGFALIIYREEKAWPRLTWCSVTLLALAMIQEIYPDAWASTREHLNIGEATGGIVGTLIMRGFLIKWLSPVGAGMLMWSVFIVSLFMFVEFRNVIKFYHSLQAGYAVLRKRIIAFINEKQDRGHIIDRENRDIEKRRKQLEKIIKKEQAEQEKVKTDSQKDRIKEPGIIRAARELLPKKKVQAKEESAKPSRVVQSDKKTSANVKTDTDTGSSSRSDYKLPSLDLLDPVQASSTKGITVDSGLTSKVLIETLKEFGIEAEVTNVEKGPVVTRYELLPAPGVRVERIASLSNNLALSLKATSVRVQAPVPGKGVVGIEVPNSIAKMVFIREILEGEKWSSSKAKLPMLLGKNIGGSDIIADLADMPHLLIAGATGAGKTVCMNSILAGLLMSRSPDDMRLLLVDPKIVEFSVYANLPHLVVPVITNPKKVALGLRWAINEMEKRYKLFAKVGVRNIDGFNNRANVAQEDMFKPEPQTSDKEGEIPDKVPYIVIVIDELADLMLVDQAEIENCVARLAQLSRAVGIHMILSTQRPSVNVITGTIKANFPARIAFQVAQKVDSRTILDSMGAEKLLGRGDMLYQPPGTSKIMRAQGAMTTDAEIRRIVDFIKEQEGPRYEVAIQEKIDKQGSALQDNGEEDELLVQATEIIRETRRASTSSLQRRLRIGYTRAARIMDILEEKGIVGPPRGSDPREILLDLDGEVPNNVVNEEEDKEMSSDDDNNG